MVDFTKPSNLEKIWANTGAKTPTPSDTEISTGWTAIIPPKEVFNYLDYKQDAMLAHINQKGVPQWDASSSYLANVSYTMGSNGIIYRAKTTHTNVNPVTDTSFVNWTVAFYFTSEVYTKSETDAKYTTKANNLSDVTNTATARSNLSVYSKAETDAKYPVIANALSDVDNTTARYNLSIYSKVESDAKYATKGANLGDLASLTSARSNLSVYSIGQCNATFNARANNLSDVASASAARTNLAVYSTTECNTAFATRAGNLSDLASVSTAFDNIKQAASDSYAGVSAFASDAELLAGANTTKAVAPAKLRLGFAISLGVTGHINFPTWLGGLQIRWSKLNVPSGGSSWPVTWSTPFSTAVLFAGTDYADTGSQSTCWLAGLTGLTGCNIDHNSSSTHAMFVWAFGY